MTTLYQIADDYKKALDFDLDTELDANALVELLGEITDRFELKAANVTAYLRNISAEKEAFEAESARLSEKAKAMDRRIEALKGYLSTEMRRCNLTECNAGLNKLKFVKNPWHVEITPGAIIPGRYMVQPPIPVPYPDKKALADALKSGEKIGGVQLKQDERLKIS
jgi:hypothetical protein